MFKDEGFVWNQYDIYLTEARGFRQDLSLMKDVVRRGCSRIQLKEMMLRKHIPKTIMQGLEQWECMMDILAYTELSSNRGLSRMRTLGKKASIFYDLTDDVVDSREPAAHIYDLSGKTQDMIYLLMERNRVLNPAAIRRFIKREKLEQNWELEMLLGDAYRRVGKLEESTATFKRLQEEIGNMDRSIQDAITLNQYIDIAACPYNDLTLESFFDSDESQQKSSYRIDSVKVGRNDPCPCGSGKKYKQCCGKIQM